MSTASLTINVTVTMTRWQAATLMRFGVVKSFNILIVLMRSSKSLRRQTIQNIAGTLNNLGNKPLAKGFMTFKECVESSIRVFGSMPRPGVPSGTIETWVDPAFEADNA